MRATLKHLMVLAFWLLVWQLSSFLVDNPILLCGPLDVFVVLATKVVTLNFWTSIGFSLVSITIGFGAALVLGLSLGAASFRISWFSVLFDPAVQFIKSVPIVCFIVLLLIWFGASYASLIAVFLVAFPAFYASAIEGLKSCDHKLFEMLKVFKVSPFRCVLAFYWPSMLPFLTAASRTIVGMSWKAGVAAELIGLPLGTIGERIYQAKITLSSADLFAWTLVIVVVSMVCEVLFLRFLEKTGDWAWRGALPRYESANSARDRQSMVEEPLVQVVDLFKEYDDVAVVNGLSFTIKRGDRRGLGGASGAGKTTLLGLLSKLIVPEGGYVSSAASVSMVFQEARLFEERNAVDNIRLVSGSYTSSDQIETLLIELLPREAIDKPVAQLSGGMRRRVELVRAFAVRSDIVLLDEPFAGLDELIRAKAHEFVLRHLNERALVVASHEQGDFEALGIEHGITV